MTDATVSRAPRRIVWAWLLPAAATLGIVLATIFVLNAPQISVRDRIAEPSATSSPPGQSERRKTPPLQQRQKDYAALPKPEAPQPTGNNPFVSAKATTGLAKPQIAKPKSATGSQPETGRASWYDLASATASGETNDADDLTAAHPTLPLGTHVLVENLDNGRSVVVRINDRGPFTQDRIIDVSKAAAAKLGMVAAGVATVRVIRAEAALAADNPTPR
jgi:rare lipoprotein A (peptidoglycan hydrolase)